MFRVLKELLWLCLYDRGGNPFTGSISKRGGGCLKPSVPIQGVATALQSRLFTAPFYDQ